MPEVDIATYATMPVVDLETMRREIILKAQGNHDNLSIEELRELAAITGVLRRKASGPPKEAKKKASTKKAPATLDDLA